MSPTSPSSHKASPSQKAPKKSKVYICRCPIYCHGEKLVGKTTYFAHLKLYKPRPVLRAEGETHERSAGPSAQLPGQSHLERPKGPPHQAGMPRDDSDLEGNALDKAHIDPHLTSRSDDGMPQGDVEPFFEHDQELDKGPEWGPREANAQDTEKLALSMDDFFDDDVRHGIEAQADEGGAPDPGSLADIEGGILGIDLPEDSDEAIVPDDDEDIKPYDVEEAGPELEPGFVPRVKVLKIAQEFIQALEKADLENGDLSPEVLDRLQNPPQHPLTIDDPDELYSLKTYLSTLNSSEETYASVRRNHQQRYPEDPMLSLDQIRQKIGEWSGVEPIVHHMCPNSCVAFTGPFAELDQCPYCQSSRYDATVLRSSKGKIKKPVQKFYTMPLGPQIQALWRTPKSAHKMGHRRRATAQLLRELEQTEGMVNMYDDIYQGDEYLNALNRGDLTLEDTMVMLSMDGAQLYRDKKSDCWMYIWQILELAADIRYQKHHVLPGCFIPGPNKPKNMDSFLFPGLHHVAALQKAGLRVWNALENYLFNSFIWLHLPTADGPGSIYLSGLVGHHGRFPCRIFCGIKGRHKPGIGHYYPALLKPHNYDVPGCNHPDINVKDIKGGSQTDYNNKLTYLLRSQGFNDYKGRRLNTGISRPTILSGLPHNHRLPIVSTFAGDSMHAPTLNLGELLVPLWRGNFQCAPTDDWRNWDWAVLKGAVWKEHGRMVANSRPYMPGSFDRPPRNIAEKINSGYKAREWQGYFYGLAPALLHNILPFEYWRHFCKLVYGVRVVHQRGISRKQLEIAQNRLDEFCVEFEHLYAQRRVDRLHFVRPCVHALIHLCLEVPRLGPPGLYSAWCMERTIGNLGQEIRQPSNPYINLSMRGLQRSQINALKAMIPDLVPDENPLPQGGMDLGDGYVLLRARERTAHILPGREGEVVNEYLRQAAAQAGVVLKDTWKGKVAKWSRLRLPTGQTARSKWKESLKPLSKLRRSRCVKLVVNGLVEFAEVQFYFGANIAGQKRALALVSLYSPPDFKLFEDSYQTVYSVTLLGEWGLRVVDVKDIVAVVSMQPHNHCLVPGEERFFVWEQMGLDMALLRGAEEEIAEEEDDS